MVCAVRGSVVSAAMVTDVTTASRRRMSRRTNSEPTLIRRTIRVVPGVSAMPAKRSRPGIWAICPAPDRPIRMVVRLKGRLVKVVSGRYVAALTGATPPRPDCEPAATLMESAASFCASRQ